jgi:hypothetical protein
MRSTCTLESYQFDAVRDGAQADLAEKWDAERGEFPVATTHDPEDHGEVPCGRVSATA